MKQKVIVILGQTATGKSVLAVKIALGHSHGRGKKINGEIISADSRQVYKMLDIGTGKITIKEQSGVPHHLLNVVNPKKKFTVTKYKQLAEEKIKEILARGNTPIVCGGSGFYIDAITRGVVFPEVPPNLKLRKTLEEKSTDQLFKILIRLDPRRAENIDRKNKVRLVRAIEIVKAIGEVPLIKKNKPAYKFVKIGLYLPKIELEKNITKRVKKMFRSGLLNEIKKLKKSGVTNKRLKELGFEYFDPTEEKVINASLKYAGRQMTWFKRDKEIKWFKPDEYKKVKKYIKG